MSPRFSKAILFFLILFTPLAFGTVEPWSYAVMEILTAAAFLSFTFSLVRKKEDLHAVPGMVPLLLFLAYILFQLVPLPPFMVEFLSPGAFSIQEKAFALTDTHSWMTLSVNHRAGLSEFFRYGKKEVSRITGC